MRFPFIIFIVAILLLGIKTVVNAEDAQAYSDEFVNQCLIEWEEVYIHLQEINAFCRETFPAGYTGKYLVCRSESKRLFIENNDIISQECLNASWLKLDDPLLEYWLRQWFHQRPNHPDF